MGGYFSEVHDGDSAVISAGVDATPLVMSEVLPVPEQREYENVGDAIPYFIPSDGGSGLPGCFDLDDDGKTLKNTWYRVEQMVYSMMGSASLGDGGGLYALRISSTNPGSASVMTYGSVGDFQAAVADTNYSFIPLYWVTVSSGERDVIDLRSIPTAVAWFASTSA